MKRIDTDKKDKRGKKFQEDQYEIKDRKLLDQAFEELSKALKKPYYKTYTMDMLKKRIADLPPTRHLEDNVVKVGICAGTLLHDLSPLRNIAKAIPFYAGKLAEEGQKEKAKQLLDGRYKIIKDMESDSFTLIEMLVIEAIAAMSEKYAEAYKKIGGPELTEKTIELDKILQEPVNKRLPRNEYGGRTQTEKEISFEKELKNRGSVLSGMLFPSLGPDSIVPTEELAAGRELEYLVIERITFHTLLSIFVCFMLFSAASMLYFYFMQGKNMPLLLIPDTKEILKIMFIGIILPTAIYLIYTRFTCFSHRDFNLIFNQFRGIGEMILLALSMIYITVSLARKWIVKRCIELGIETKFKQSIRSEKIMYSILTALYLSCIFLPKTWMPVTVIIIGIFALFFLISSLFSQWREYPVVSGAIARSVIPVYSLSIILLCLLVQPCLEMRERYLMQNDPFVIRTTDDMIGFTNIEIELVKRMRKDYEEVFRQTGL